MREIGCTQKQENKNKKKEEGSTCPLAAWFLTMLLCLALVVSVIVLKEGDKELNPVSPSTSPGVGSKTKLGPGA